jgi:hypothetical protein
MSLILPTVISWYSDLLLQNPSVRQLSRLLSCFTMFPNVSLSFWLIVLKSTAWILNSYHVLSLVISFVSSLICQFLRLRMWSIFFFGFPRRLSPSESPNPTLQFLICPYYESILASMIFSAIFSPKPIFSFLHSIMISDHHLFVSSYYVFIDVYDVEYLRHKHST